MDNFIKIDIPYKSHLANLVKGYITTFPTVKNLRCEAIKSNVEDELELEIDFGINYIDYKFEEEYNTIIIDYKEIGDSVGTYYCAEKLEKLVVMIEHNESNYIQKRNCISKFLKDAKNHYNKKDENEIVCKILKNGYWSVLSKLPKRDMDTIYLSDKKKNEMINDISKFKKSKEEYKNLGIPWKRNYLLEGPPGTGKSSLIFALASKFNMNIHIINLGPKVDDSTFMSAVSNLPNNTILLLEDIDALFVERKANDSNKSMVSFSGILNVLDGMAMKSGLVTFMTTNFVNRLDKALIRPSRVDLIVRFDDATKEQISQMFHKFFPEREDFEKFYDKICYLKCSICAIQKFFMHLKFNTINIEKELFNSKFLKEIIEEMDNKSKNNSNIYV